MARNACGEGSPLGAVEVARLEAQRRLARDAAHTLNNALTAALGEIGFLRDERKGDAVVVEACDAVARELERCVRAAAPLSRRRGSAPGPTDLVRATRDAAALLRTALGSLGELALRVPDDLVLVGADAADLDLLVVLLVQTAVERIGRSARLLLSVEPGAGGGARLALEARVAAASVRAEEGASALADDPAARNQVLALALLAERSGGALALEVPAPGHWRARVDLPLVRPR